MVGKRRLVGCVSGCAAVWLAVAAVGAAPALAAVRPGAAQEKRATRPAETARPLGEAYLQFLLARRLEAAGDTEGALAALRRAAELDPRGAEVRAELANVLAARDQYREALAAAEEALSLDPENTEAHRVMGLVYAELADRPGAARRKGIDGSVDDWLARAADHLERAGAAEDSSTDGAARFALARVYLHRGDHAKAVAVLRRLVDEEPDPSEATLFLAEAYAGAGAMAEARRTLEAALREDPSFLRARLQLAALDEREGRFAEAAAEYARALEQYPGNVDITRRRAQALLRAGDAAGARDAVRPLAARDRPGAADLYLLARAESELGDLEAAEATARRLMAVAPEDLRGPEALADVLERRRDWPALVALLEPVAARPPQGAEPEGRFIMLLVRLGFAYQALGRFDRAVATFEQVRTLTPTEPAGAIYLGQAYVAAGRAGDALALVSAARREFPHEPRLVEVQADALRRLGRLDEAVALVRDAARADPSPSLAVALAELHVAARRFDDALAVVAQARTVHPDDEELLFELGAIYERAGRDAEAERAFRDLLARNPRHAPALNYLGYMLVERGRSLQEALELISRALQHDPANPAYLDSLGWAYVKLNRLDLAEAPLRQAAAALVTNSVVQDHLGDLLAKLGRVDEAIAAWQRALAGDGESIDRAVVEAKIKTARAKVRRR